MSNQASFSPSPGTYASHLCPFWIRAKAITLSLITALQKPMLDIMDTTSLYYAVYGKYKAVRFEEIVTIYCDMLLK